MYKLRGHLLGDESIFTFPRCVKGCADFRDPTAVFRFKTHQRFNGFTGPLNGNGEKSRQRRSRPLPPLLTPNFFLLTSNFSLFHWFGELRW